MLKRTSILGLAVALTAGLASAQTITHTTTTTTRNPDGSETSRTESTTTRGMGGWMMRGFGGGYHRQRPLTAQDVAGGWKAVERWNNADHACAITLQTNVMFGKTVASSQGCFGSLFAVSLWEVQGDGVMLYKPGGAFAARLDWDGRQLAGSAADGQRVMLYR